MAVSNFLSSIESSLNQGIDSLKQSAKLSINSKINNKVEGLATPLPWQSIPSTFFKYIAIQPDRWDQLYPYRLVVFDIAKNSVVNGNPQTAAKVVTNKDSGRMTVEFTKLGNQWIFQLPITPQQLNISDPFAIGTTATLRGVIEEHNGIKFKMINASGTMGVWPYRDSVTDPPASPNFVQSVFGGTLEAISGVANQISSVINTATSGHPASKPISKRPETSSAGVTSTGYYNALALQQFLEQYAEAKKRPENASWRLVFDIPKQNQSLVVTPVQFVWQQNESKPSQIMYSFQLRAWRRIDLQLPSSPISPSIQPISPGILQRILNTVTAARSVMSSVVDLIRAVRSDVEKPLEVLRQTSLFVKDLTNAAVTAADLPSQIQKDYSSAIKDSLYNQKDIIAASSSNVAVRNSIDQIVKSSKVTEGLSISAVSSGQLGLTASQAQSIDPSYNVFSQPERNFDLIDNVPISDLNMNFQQQNDFDNMMDNIRQTTVDDLKQYRSVILDLALQISNNFGTGDSFYNQVYGKSTPTTRVTPITIDQYDILKSLYDVIQSYDILTASKDIDSLNKQTNMEYVADLATNSDMTFQISSSKILAPVPFGLTIEAIAARYLGDPNRWLEIVTLNNLQDPYIDENGFQLSLLSNATGRQITISSIENIYVGQLVTLHSATQIPSSRRILGIDRLSDTSYLLTLDGLANLDNFTTADNAYIQAYLPGTVNSQQNIFIPSDLEVPNDPDITIPPSVSGENLAGLSKVDLLLTDSGDLAVNSFGDFRFAAGMSNLIQAIKIKLSTQKGKLLMHPDFGLGIKVGSMISEVDVQEIYNSIDKMISDDPRFDGISNLQIEINGPKLSISLGVVLANRSGVFPLSFDMPMAA